LMPTPSGSSSCSSPRSFSSTPRRSPDRADRARDRAPMSALVVPIWFQSEREHLSPTAETLPKPAGTSRNRTLGRSSHNPKVAGSNPAFATRKASMCWPFVLLRMAKEYEPAVRRLRLAACGKVAAGRRSIQTMMASTPSRLAKSRSRVMSGSPWAAAVAAMRASAVASFFRRWRLVSASKRP